MNSVNSRNCMFMIIFMVLLLFVSMMLLGGNASDIVMNLP